MPYDADQIDNLEDEVDALVTPTTEDVLAVSQDYDAGIVAASALRQAAAGGGGSQPIVQSGPPEQGTNASQGLFGVPTGPFTLTYLGQTTDPIAEDATFDEITAALELLSTIGDGNIRPYPGYGPSSLAVDEEGYVQFIRDLGAQPIDLLVCSDGDVEVAGDATGVPPNPVGELGQSLFDTDSLFIYERRTPSFSDAGQLQSAECWAQILPQPEIASADGRAEFSTGNPTSSVVSYWEQLGLDPEQRVRLSIATDSGDLLIEARTVGGDNSVIQYRYNFILWQIYTSGSGLVNELKMNADGSLEHNGMLFITGTVDPSAGGGVLAAIGSRYTKTDDGTQWAKTGAGDTAWEQLAFVP